MGTVTVFKNILDLSKPNYVNIKNIYERIRGGKDKDAVIAIRQAADKKTRSKLKMELPCILFSGRFEARFDDKLLEHSGRVVLDWDNLGDAIHDKRAEIKSYDFVEAVFTSPSGDGLKAVVKIPANKEKHRGFYRGLMQVFPDIDSTSINESRVCYSSFDPAIYVNPNAVDFEVFIEEAPIAQRKFPESEYKAVQTNYDKINIAAKMIREAADGEKHAKLLAASRLMGGYIGGGMVDENEAIRVLESEIQQRDIDNFPGAQKTIRDGVGYGKALPIHEMERLYGVSQPENTGIKPADAVWEGMKHTFVHGKKRGETTHFELFNENFKWKAGEITLVIARPNYGKTEFVLQLMLMKSVFCGWKWGIFSPENYPEDEFYDTLIHAYIGKTTDPFWGPAQMTIQEYEKGYEFVRKHFFYVYPEIQTVEEVRKNFLYLVETEGINGTFSDPFNQFEIDFGARQDLFLSQYLRDCKRFAVKYQLCDVISTHPKAMMRDKNGNYAIPDIYDIWGGAMWGNKMDNIMVIDRPNMALDPQDGTVDIILKKIKKQKLVGALGTCRFEFQRKTNRYYIDGINPLEDKVYTPERPKSFEDTTRKIQARPLRLSLTKSEREDEEKELF